MDVSRKIISLYGNEQLINTVINTTEHIQLIEDVPPYLLEELLQLKDEYLHGHYFEESPEPIEGRPRHSENTLMDFLDQVDRINDAIYEFGLVAKIKT